MEVEEEQQEEPLMVDGMGRGHSWRVEEEERGSTDERVQKKWAGLWVVTRPSRRPSAQRGWMGEEEVEQEGYSTLEWWWVEPWA